jgi:hypothetical protein
MKKANKHTRAGSQGKNIYCPCGKATHVYHFNWIGLGCKCGEMVSKEDWYIEDPKILGKKDPLVELIFRDLKENGIEND